MKYLLPICCAVVLFFTNSCKEADEFQDIIYFTGTEESNTVSFAIDGPSSMGLSVTASDLVSTDTKINLQIRPELIEDLNRQTGKNYVIPPTGSYNLSADNVVLQAGKHVSEQVVLHITATDGFEEGANYCIPISITGTDGNMSVLEPSRTVYVVIRKTIITQAVNLRKSTYFTVPSFLLNPEMSALPEVTLECRVLANSFHASNPYISSIIGIEEKFLIRFGDVSIARDEIMLAGGDVTGAGHYQLAAADKFVTGKWYHVAAVYTGSEMILYIDGRKAASTEAAKGVVDFSYDWAGGFHIGYSADGRKLDGYVSEARVWSKALTASQLQENLCYVNPVAEGLVAYWRFNDSDGRNVPDLTGHGHTAVASENITWVTGVRCP
jgi:hypothetical protein